MSDVERSTVYADLARRLGTPNLREWIEDRAEELARLGNSDTGSVWITPAVRAACGVAAIVPKEMGARAQVWSEGEEVLVGYRPQLDQHARRVAVAHELGHTLWFAEAGRTENISGLVIGTADWVIEALCDYFAGALLMPRSMVRAYVGAKRSPSGMTLPPLHLIPALAVRFRVPDRVAAWRLLIVSGDDDLTIVGARDLARRSGPLLDEEQTEPLWQVMWHVRGSMQQRVPVPPGYCRPFDTHRRLPAEMVPRLGHSIAVEGPLDGRWRTGLLAHRQRLVRRPIRLWERTPSMTGVSYRSLSLLYVGVPGRELPESRMR